MKLKVGQLVRIPNTTSADAGLKAMRIPEQLCGKQVRISQVSPHGVSFEISPTNPTERHLGARFVKDVLNGEV